MPRKALGLSALCVSLCSLSACGNIIAIAGVLSFCAGAQRVLSSYQLGRDTGPMHDLSLIRQGGTYYAFTSDFLG